MANLIDRAVLWMLTACSAFLLMLTVTNGRIIPSCLLTFLILSLLRCISQYIPDKRRISRKKKLNYADRLIHSWILMPEASAREALLQMLPSLLNSHENSTVRLLQLLPDSDGLTANLLLKIWRQHTETKHLLLIATCPTSSGARSLVPELISPAVTLIDSTALRLMLARSIQSLPEINIQKERRKPSFAHIAQYLRRIQPVRAGLYCIFFLAMYLLTDMPLYLAAAVLLALMLILYRFASVLRSPA